MGARSRNKGKRGEREFSRYLSEHGLPARRGAQHCGGPDSPDVVCESLDGIRFEVKRCEALRLHDALSQAVDEAGGRVPIVAHRKNRGRWIAVLAMDDLLKLLRGTNDD